MFAVRHRGCIYKISFQDGSELSPALETELFVSTHKKKMYEGSKVVDAGAAGNQY